MIQTEIEIPNYIIRRLSQEEWQAQQKRHKQIIAEIVDPYLRKKQEQHKDPVLDFLFDYYAFRPSHLERWSPGFGVFLEDTEEQALPFISEFIKTEKGSYLDVAQFPENRKKPTRWILKLLKNSLDNDPSFGCFGMHEWAMVYKADNIRHTQLQLRMPKDELADFVESRPLLCTHFDAFRFFTEDAKPMNKFGLSRDESVKNEQAGCLHTNMDLYKWAFKLFPWISSNTIREAFLLAVDTRTVDMKASPYDLRNRGLEPIKIETKEGRLEYADRQKEIYRRSVPVRKQLIEEYEQLIEHI